MLPSYTSVMQEQQQESGHPGLQASRSEQQPNFRRSYETNLHEQQPQRSQVSNPLTGSVKDGALEVNLTFLQSPAGGLLAVSTILGLVVGICGASTPGHILGGGFCVFSGLLHFAGGGFFYLVYLFNFLSEMPWYTRALAIYYFKISAGVSLIAFVYSVNNSNSPAAIASAVFTFLSLAVDIVLIVLSYMALKMGYATAGQAAVEAGDA